MFPNVYVLRVDAEVCEYLISGAVMPLHFFFLFSFLNRAVTLIDIKAELWANRKTKYILQGIHKKIATSLAISLILYHSPTQKYPDLEKDAQLQLGYGDK